MEERVRRAAETASQCPYWSIIMRLFVVSIILVCLLLFPPSPVWAEYSSTTPKDLTEACDALAHILVSGVPDGKSVAVRRFSPAGGIPTLLGLRIQDLLTNALSAVENRKFHVVERLRMTELDLERMTYGSTRGDDPDQWAQGRPTQK